MCKDLDQKNIDTNLAKLKQLDQDALTDYRKNISIPSQIQLISTLKINTAISGAVEFKKDAGNIVRD